MMKAYIELGSTKEFVKHLMGEPSESSVDFWTYGTSHVKFNQEGLLVAWKNMFNELTEYMQPYVPTDQKLQIGMTKEEVLQVLGAPTAIIDASPEEWKYEASHVKFDVHGQVNEWKNVYDQITYGLQGPELGNNLHLEIGMEKKDLLRCLGAPSMLLAMDPNTWHYQASHVKLQHDRVIEWVNLYNQLEAGMQSPEETEDYLKLGMGKNAVLKLLGSPSAIIASDPEVWKYESSFVRFEADKVIEWRSMFGQLKRALKKPMYQGFIKIGLSKEEVLNIIGSPDSISRMNSDLWHYDSSHVKFKDGKLCEYRCQFHDFDKGLMKGSSNEDDIEVGSDKEVVLKRLGSPTAIFEKEPDVWHYGNANVYFDRHGHVKTWQNIDDIKRTIKSKE